MTIVEITPDPIVQLRTDLADPKWDRYRPKPEMAALHDAVLAERMREFHAKYDPLKSEHDALSEKIKRAKQKFGGPDWQRIWDLGKQIGAIEEEYKDLTEEHRRREWRQRLLTDYIAEGLHVGRNDLAKCPELLDTHGDQIVRIREVYARSKGYQEAWRTMKSPADATTDRQKLILNTVQEALNSGLFYNRDMDAFIRQKLAGVLPQDELDAKTSRVEGGDFGMEVYYARKLIEAEKDRQEMVKAAQDFPVGRVIPRLKVQFKQYTGGKVIEVNTQTGIIKLTARRGGRSWDITAAPGGIEVLSKKSATA